MGILDLFSKRQKRARGEVVDVYNYDNIPRKLRVQLVQILESSLGSYHEYMERYGYPEVKNNYNMIVSALCKEYGVFKLCERSSYNNPVKNCSILY